MKKVGRLTVFLLLCASLYMFAANLLSVMYKPLKLYISAAVLCVMIVLYLKEKFSRNSTDTHEGKKENAVLAAECVGIVGSSLVLKSVLPESFSFNICLTVIIIGAILLVLFIRKVSELPFINCIKDYLVHTCVEQAYFPENAC